MPNAPGSAEAEPGRTEPLVSSTRVRKRGCELDSSDAFLAMMTVPSRNCRTGREELAVRRTHFQSSLSAGLRRRAPQPIERDQDRIELDVHERVEIRS